mmetsp:Transcript_39247/g.100279  ORF Transcript_39247/g.100279 Transcript_39247/m.100279 type:complete len:633 (+) Transcript_39247:470-2368(+)
MVGGLEPDGASRGESRFPPISKSRGNSRAGSFRSENGRGLIEAPQPESGTAKTEMAIVQVKEQLAQSMRPAPGGNPFVVPQKEDVFAMRKQEKLAKAEERARLQGCSVAEKSTFTSRVTYPNAEECVDDGTERTRKGAKAGGLNMITRPPGKMDSFRGTGTARSGNMAVVSGAAAAEFRRTEKESMKDFIGKKREIFLVQMQLDTKKEEILKLESGTAAREEQVRCNEAMLEEDALRFDAFLKENDVKVQEAVKRADAESKAKIDKIQEIKHLHLQIEAMRSELSKFEEQLEECRRYKAFIDGLTPQEFFDAQEEQRRLRSQRRIEDWEAEVEKVRETKKSAALRLQQAKRDFANAQSQQAAERAEQEVKDAGVALEESKALEEPPRPPEQEEDEEDDIPEIFFKHPQELLERYRELESKNLFLIQNIQESEELLEEMKTRSATSTLGLDSRISQLQEQERHLDLELAAERSRVAELQRRTSKAGGGDDQGKDRGISTDQEVVDGVRSVYSSVGFELDNSVGVLTMLTNIENKMEEYLRVVATMPDDFVEMVEKSCEKERRKQLREEKIEEQRVEREARLKTAMERAKAPVHKKKGKPDMFRSQPPKKKETVVVEKTDTEKLELEAFLARND